MTALTLGEALGVSPVSAGRCNGMADHGDQARRLIRGLEPFKWSATAVRPQTPLVMKQVRIVTTVDYYLRKAALPAACGRGAAAAGDAIRAAAEDLILRR
jgi:hypothetical protein